MGPLRVAFAKDGNIGFYELSGNISPIELRANTFHIAIKLDPPPSDSSPKGLQVQCKMQHKRITALRYKGSLCAFTWPTYLPDATAFTVLESTVRVSC
jgi:hypothetical protein